MSETALLLSGLAVAVSLVTLALVLFWAGPGRYRARQSVPEEDAPPNANVHEDAAWHGNHETGYVRGPFTVCRMPTRGTDLLRGQETEWVAYRDGERAFASPDLEDVLRVCEIAESE